MPRSRPTIVASLPVAYVADDNPLARFYQSPEPLLAGQRPPQPPFVAVKDAVYEEAVGSLRAAGWEVSVIDGSHLTSKAASLAALRDALNLPDSVTNWDALADSLRDLPDFGNAAKVALLWHQPEILAEADQEDWATLADILQDAREEAWGVDGSNPRDCAFDVAVCAAPISFDETA